MIVAVVLRIASMFQWRFSYFSELQVLKWLLQLCFGLLACCRASLLIAVSFSVYTGCVHCAFRFTVESGLRAPPMPPTPEICFCFYVLSQNGVMEVWEVFKKLPGGRTIHSVRVSAQTEPRGPDSCTGTFDMYCAPTSCVVLRDPMYAVERPYMLLRDHIYAVGRPYVLLRDHIYLYMLLEDHMCF